MSLWLPPTEDTDPLEYDWGGVAMHGNTRFDCKLITKLADTLWMGGCIDGLKLPDEVAYVVSLYPWESYRPGASYKDSYILRAYDAELDDPTPYIKAAHVANAFRSRGVTLIHCQAGLNRSGLVTTLALMLEGLDGEPMSAEEALAFLREKRTPAVVCNPHFAEWLEDEAAAALEAYVAEAA